MQSFKRLHYEDWRDWQKDAYIGIHTRFDYVPAADARGYQYMVPTPVQVPVMAAIKPCNSFDKPAPQVEFWFPKEEKKRTLGQRLRNWINK